MAEKIVERVDENRRGFVKRLLGVSFAVPVIATFSLGALTASKAKATDFAYTPDGFCRPDLEAAFSYEGAAGTGRCMDDSTPTD